MTDPAGGDPGSELRCPWCSSAVPVGATTCPSCGAALSSAAEDDTSIPGVTQIDPVTAARKPIARPNRLVSWLAGDLDPLPPPNPIAADRPSPPASNNAPLEGAGQASYAPPSAAVRREMARLELDAIKAELEAQSGETSPDISAGASAGDGEMLPDPTTSVSDEAPVKPEGETAG